MKYPKLKNTTLCYIILIVIMLLEGLIACVILKLKFLPQDIIIILFIAYDIGYIIHILKSFNLFLTVSEILVEYDLNNKARKYFFSPALFLSAKLKKEYQPLANLVNRQQSFLFLKYLDIKAADQ